MMPLTVALPSMVRLAVVTPAVAVAELPAVPRFSARPPPTTPTRVPPVRLTTESFTSAVAEPLAPWARAKPPPTTAPRVMPPPLMFTVAVFMMLDSVTVALLMALPPPTTYCAQPCGFMAPMVPPLMFTVVLLTLDVAAVLRT